jgi:hypothetical protein
MLLLTLLNYMPAELVPLKAGQHAVILVPKATTDLPFFYFTKQKARLNQDINYQGVDFQGRPMRWQVFPNSNPSIGAPGIDAHEAWMRLVKPTFDQYSAQGMPLDILPLGRVRESLRKVGWGEGGWEARRLLRALHQIGAASCVADLWIPTAMVDEKGEATFQHINATFSKLTLYAIGSKHLTEEQLHDGQFDFDFDLEDTLYVQLNPVEIQIQKNQPQRLIDTKYLFSVKPTARRWYELVAPKIFGVVKNEGKYCEIRYSWYIKHHHTLKRYYERYRVVFQMNRLIRDHIDRGYVSKVEYRAVKESGQELDWIIRYYPGEGARISIHRILSHQYNKPDPPNEHKPTLKSLAKENQKEPILSEQGIDQVLFAELVKRGVSNIQSRTLLRGLGQDQQTLDQIEWGDQLIAQSPPGKFYNPSGLYIHLIKENVIPPSTFESSRKRKLRLQIQQARQDEQQEQARLQLAYEEYKKREIDDYIAAHNDEYHQYVETKKQELLARYKSLSLWDDQTLARLAETSATAEIAKRISFFTFQAFCQEEKLQSLTSPASEQGSGNPDQFLTV